MSEKLNRRDFLKTGSAVTTGGLLAGGLRPSAWAAPEVPPARAISPNDHIQLALIGAGNQGQGDTHIAVQVPGVTLVAAADCYDGRLVHCREVWGNSIFTTRDYREILARSDVDAVLIATPDHWHKQAAIDAMNAGKDVYLEKPMIHLYSDGPEIIETARKTQRILQVGSQRVSSMIYKKAKQLIAAGAIGQLTVINAWWDQSQLSRNVLRRFHTSRCLAGDNRLAAFPRLGSPRALQRRTLLSVAEMESLRQRRGGGPFCSPFQRHAFHH